jgi:hypothetical protein
MYRKAEMRRPGGKLQYNHREPILEGWHHSVSCQGWMMERGAGKEGIDLFCDGSNKVDSTCLLDALAKVTYL